MCIRDSCISTIDTVTSGHITVNNQDITKIKDKAVSYTHLDVYKRQIRDSLFSIQVEQPWLLLQFGNSNAEEIGTDRVEALVSASPEDEDGKTREEVVKTEIEDNDNNNLTIPQVVNRLGMVFFLFIFNIGITIFVFLLTGIMMLSQILFIIFAMFLPISFLLSMIPS